MSVALSIQHAMGIRHMPTRLYNIIPRYLIKGTISEKKIFFFYYYLIHPQERQLPRNSHQSNSPTTGRIRKVLRTTLRSQTELESTHYKETETN